MQSIRRLNPAPAEIDEDDIDEFLKAVLGISDNYEAAVSKMRKAGTLKSFLGDFGDGGKPFSLLNAIKTAAESRDGRPAGYEGEVSQQIINRMPSGAIRGFAVPLSALSVKTLYGGSLTTGGALMQTDVADPLAALRGASVVARAGAVIRNGINTRSLSIPRGTAGTTAQWLPELGEIQMSDPQFDALLLRPRRIGALAKYTRETNVLTQGQTEDWTRRDLIQGLATQIDSGALGGTGGVEPLGITNSPFAQRITFGGAATYDDAVEMEYLVSNANAPDGNICFISTPAVRKKWRLTPRLEGESVRLWEGGEVCGKPAMVTTNVPGNRVICGAFNHYTIGMFGVIDVQVNPYTEDYKGVVRVVLNAWADCGELYPLSFCASTDAGNQA